MRRFRKTLPLLALVFSACSSPTPVDEVDSIVESHLAARGGKERIQALQSIRGTGRATAGGGRTANVIYEIKRPGFYRLEFSYQGTKSVFAHDGETGWLVDPLQGIMEPQRTNPEMNSDAGIDERDIEGPLVNWREKGHVVELEGREQLAGGEAFKLKVTLHDGLIRYDYIDVESRQIVRSDRNETIRGHRKRMVETFSDFRDVDGLVLPHLIENSVEDRPEVITIEVERFELDPKLDDSRFHFPE
jgi:hypothetical protein